MSKVRKRSRRRRSGGMKRKENVEASVQGGEKEEVMDE